MSSLVLSGFLQLFGYQKRVHSLVADGTVDVAIPLLLRLALVTLDDWRFG